ncbi:hypothetical protein ACTDI4_18060 [Mesorhizobium sp. PUT5]|uniref:hypothetical protein n=1 Tax=Mesorhizobium sp. PUT5 TaxID=3454629 RepID=UPI003FA4C969
MSNVFAFPRPFQERIEITAGMDMDTGRQVFLFDLKMADGSCIIDDCATLEEVERKALDYQREGYAVSFLGLRL